MIIPLMNSLKKLSIKLIILSVILFCLGSVSCSFKNSPALSKNSTSSTISIQTLEKDEYEVFSAFLNQQENNKSEPLIILFDETTNSAPASEELGLQLKENTKEKYPTIFDALKNFRARKKEAISIERSFNLDKKYKLISESYFKSFLNTSPSKTWQKFRAENEGVTRVQGFSRVGFDSQRNVAIFFHETINYESYGNFHVFVKIGESWKLVETFGGYET